MKWLDVKGQGLVRGDRIVAVGRAEAAAMKRLISAVPLDKIISLTAGRKRQSVIVLDSGHVVITALTVAQIGQLLRGDKKTQE